MYNSSGSVIAVASGAATLNQKGDTVLDLFGGSGTTMIAAERIGRQAVLLEIDPRYVDVIVRRWQESAGAEAKLDGMGDRTFNEIAAARGAPTTV